MTAEEILALGSGFIIVHRPTGLQFELLCTRMSGDDLLIVAEQHKPSTYGGERLIRLPTDFKYFECSKDTDTNEALR